MAALRDLFVAIIVFGSLPFILKRPFWGILMLAGLGFMNPHRLCYGFMRDMPVVYIVTLTTLISMLKSPEPKKLIVSREIGVLAVFILWMGITTTQAAYFDLALEQYTKVVKIQILIFLTLLMLSERKRLDLFLWAVVLSLGFYGVKGGIFTIMNGGVHRVQGPPGTFIEGNNEMALALVMTIPLMRYLHLQEKRRWIRNALALAIMLTALAAVGSQSRGALIALACTGTIFWLKSRNKMATALLLGIVASVAMNIMPDEYFARMNTIKSYEQDASALGRLNAWWTAFNVANSRLFGGGFEMWHSMMFQLYAPDTQNVRDVHSIYFEVMGEHGWIGFALFMTLLVSTWMKCGSVIRLTRKRPDELWARDLAQMIQVSLIGYMSAGAFLGLAYFDYFYYLIAVVVVLHHLVTQPKTQSQPVPGVAGRVPAPA